MARGFVYAKTLLAFAIVFWMMMSVPIPSEPEKSAQTSAAGSRTFVIGAVDFMGYMATLNPFRTTSYQEMMSILPCMSTLLTYDVDGNLIGDLAQSWTMSADGLTLSFMLQPNLYFTDPASPNSKTHPLTWLDIQYTYYQAQNFTNHLQSYFLYRDQGVIQTIWGDANHVNIRLVEPYAPFIGALAAVPIIPKYYWEPHEDVRGDATTWYAALPIGSGPWYYALPGLPTTGEVVLQRNPIWFQEVDRGWQVHVNTLKYRSETDPNSAWNNLKAGLTDMVMDLPPSIYLSDQPLPPQLMAWAQGNGFVYEYTLCQMTDEMRTSLGNPFNYGHTSQILQDPVVKRAMAMAVDKQAFVDQVLYGFGSPADSLVPLESPWHYSPQNQVAFDLDGANALLQSNGYLDTDLDGIRECTASCPAVVNGWADEFTELSFRFDTLSPEPEWAVGGGLIRDWAAQIGIKLNLTLLTIGPMNNKWMTANFDAFLWYWEFTPTSDPSTDIMYVLTTSAIGTWSDAFWSNETFDRIYNESLVQMDPVGRRSILNQLQQMAYDSMGCQPVAYKNALYAANHVRWADSSFAGCGSKWALSPESCYPWLYVQLSPADNLVPIVSAGPAARDCLAAVASEFRGTATDASPLEYQWFWGDGTSTGWVNSSIATHAYADGGYYTAYFAAREIGTADAFISWAQTAVTVYDDTNGPPSGLSFTVTPPSPEARRPATFAGSATDLEGDPLTFSWDFGDGSTARSIDAQHTYSSPGTYLVTMNVTDNQPGPGRPVYCTMSVVVAPVNSPPTISVPAYPVVSQGVATLFHVSASDVDGDPLRFTWFWGDGDWSVTATPWAVHTYAHRKVHTLTVYADDLTGVTGHNVSASNTVTVTPLIAQPTIVSYTAFPLITTSGEPVTFTGSAMCSNGGPLKFTFNFGDTSYEVVNTGDLYGLEVATVTVTHAYSSAGTMVTGLAVSNQQSLNTSSPPITVVVLDSQEPVVSPLDPVIGVAGESLTFVADAYDPDGSVLSYTWDFGDGSTLHAGNPVTYTYVVPGTFKVTLYVDDHWGHNVSVSTTATIGFRLHLDPGWNLVSIPLEGSRMASTLPLTPGDVVAHYNSTTQTYDETYVVGLPVNDFPMVKHTGYWIYSTSEKDVILYGQHPGGAQTIVIDVPSGGGWAAIAFCWPYGVHVSSFDSFVTVTGATVSIVVRWAAGAQTYYTYIVGLPLNDFMLLPGQAYWIFVSNDCTLTYNADLGIIYFPT